MSTNHFCLKIFGNKQNLEKQLFERRKFEKWLRNAPSELKRRYDGSFGPVRFTIVYPESEDGLAKIVYRELERAPLVNNSSQRFRKSFPLTDSYNLVPTTELRGDSPVEELLLFTHRNVMQHCPLSAVVSVLTVYHCATAFRVAPSGTFLTCFHNLYAIDSDYTGNPVQIYLHNKVYSQSLAYAGPNTVSASVQPCVLPELSDTVKDPLDETAMARTDIVHSDIAALQSDCPGTFLIPCAEKQDIGQPIVCFGYPRSVSLQMIQSMYQDIESAFRPDLEDYGECFKNGCLSASPGPIVGSNGSIIATEIATTPGFSGSPICLMKDPRMFIGIHYRARAGMDHSLAVSVHDPGFYCLYTRVVVPKLRTEHLTELEKTLINNYLSLGDCDLLV